MSVCIYCVCFSEIESPVKYQNQWPQPSPNPLLCSLSGRRGKRGQLGPLCFLFKINDLLCPNRKRNPSLEIYLLLNPKLWE